MCADLYALVTGGGSGLGYYFSRELRKRGYDVVIVSRSEEKLKRASMDMKATYHAIDLSKDFKKVGKIVENYHPNVVINNAGFGLYGYFPRQNFEEIERMIKLNITALTYITQRAINVMEDSGGYILNVASVAACRPLPKMSVYAATKSYVEHFTKSLYEEVQPNIHLSYLLLGPTRTNFFKNAGMDTEKIERWFLKPEKVVKYALDRMFSGRTRIVPGFVFKIYCLFS